MITQYVILNVFFQRLFASLNQRNNPKRGKMFIFSKVSSITVWGFNRPGEIMEKLQESSVQQESSWGVYCFLLSYFVYLWVQFPQLFLKFLCLVQTDPCLHSTPSPVHNLKITSTACGKSQIKIAVNNLLFLFHCRMNKWSMETYSMLRKEEAGSGTQLYFLRSNKGSQRPQQKTLKTKNLQG